MDSAFFLTNARHACFASQEAPSPEYAALASSAFSKCMREGDNSAKQSNTLIHITLRDRTTYPHEGEAGIHRAEDVLDVRELRNCRRAWNCALAPPRGAEDERGDDGDDDAAEVVVGRPPAASAHFQPCVCDGKAVRMLVT